MATLTGLGSDSGSPASIRLVISAAAGFGGNSAAEVDASRLVAQTGSGSGNEMMAWRTGGASALTTSTAARSSPAETANSSIDPARIPAPAGRSPLANAPA